MVAYLLAQVDVRDMQQYREYTAKTPDIIAKYGGRFLTRGGEVVTLEGAESSGRIVLIEFPSLETGAGFLCVAGVSGGEGTAPAGLHGQLPGFGWCGLAGQLC